MGQGYAGTVGTFRSALREPEGPKVTFYSQADEGLAEPVLQ